MERYESSIELIKGAKVWPGVRPFGQWIPLRLIGSMVGMETPELQQDGLVEKGERILTNRDLAARWQCSTSFLEKRDRADLPPRCAVLPGQIRYRLSDVELFEASRVDPNHPLTRSHQSPANSPEPPARRTGRPRAAVVATPGFPIRLPVTIDPGRRRRGRPPKPAVDECDSE